VILQVRDYYGRTSQASLTIGSSPTVYLPGYPYGTVYAAAAYANGTLVSDGGTIYQIYRNTKSGFANANAFLGLGYQFSSVVNGATGGIPDTGFVINNALHSHPWGSWLKWGSTVYFVHEQGLIPVPSWEVFLSNGGQQVLVVAANSYDLRLPYLSVMASVDPRLQ
jgi:hypothetical protein